MHESSSAFKPHPLLRRIVIGVGLIVAIVSLSGCDLTSPFDDGPRPQILQASSEWQAAVEADEYSGRLRSLTAGIDRLREESGTPWVGRQDDHTGYLAELSGGAWRSEGDAEAKTRALMEGFSQDLFGIPATQIAIVASETGQNDITALRAEQRHGGVRVLDGQLVITLRDDQIISARGRVFPGVQVGTDPEIEPGRAARIAEEASGGTAQGDPDLAILPPTEATSAGVLTWQVTIAGGDDEVVHGSLYYFVDAHRGGVVATRPATAEAASATASSTGNRSSTLSALAASELPRGESVDISGRSRKGTELRGKGLRKNSGQIVLADTTTASYEADSGRGAIYTFDAAGLDDKQIDALPGKEIDAVGGTVSDPDAIGAHVFSRYVYDYFRDVHGRDSWDGRGGALISSVNFGDESFCNAFFNGGLDPPQMVYGGACFEGGQEVVGTMVDIDTAGHEITHGVIDTSSGLIYSGQSGALNESFADYFGNAIGNLFEDKDGAELFEDGCADMPETRHCSRSPNGILASRYLLNGNTMDDYLRLLDPPFFQKAVLEVTQDHGGVHYNSAIWNNALWGIRTELAKIDGTSGNESPRAREFDAVVYGALTRYLTPTSGFLDARRAVEAAALEVGADPTTQRVIREQMDFNKICADCSVGPSSGAEAIETSPATQKSPGVAGDRIAWMEFHHFWALGKSMLGSSGGPKGQLDSGDTNFAVAFAGPDALLSADVNLSSGSVKVVRHDLKSGGRTELIDDRSVLDIAGSDAGAAFVQGNGALTFVTPSGNVSTAQLGPNMLAEGESLTLLATGGGTVALGGDQGTAITWRPGSQPSVLGERAPGGVVGLAIHGDAVAVSAADIEGIQARSVPARATVLLYDGGGGPPLRLTDSGSVFGVALSDRYVVWPEVTGALGGGINEQMGGAAIETDLFLYSLSTGKTYNMLDQRGQQGFPAISERRVVWQDAVLGGDDIFSAILPNDL